MEERNENNSHNELAEEEQKNDINIPESVYQQWYERDQERFEIEKNAITEKYPDFRAIVLNDARLCFTGTVDKEEFSAICHYDHPLPPPKIIYLGNNKYSFVDESGEIDIFAIDNNTTWNPNNTLIVDVLERLELLLKIENMIKKEKADDSDTERPADNL